VSLASTLDVDSSTVIIGERLLDFHCVCTKCVQTVSLVRDEQRSTRGPHPCSGISLSLLCSFRFAAHPAPHKKPPACSVWKTIIVAQAFLVNAPGGDHLRS